MNRDEEIMESLRSQGVDLPTLGEMMGDTGTPAAPRVQPPRFPDQPEFPAPGVYIGMPEEVYHSIPGCSTSGLKEFSTSCQDFWEGSWMNPDREERVSAFFDYGKATHVFVIEGEAEYLRRYFVGLELSDFEGENIIVSTEQIKAAIGAFEELQPVKPVGTKKQDLLDQLVDLSERHGVAVDREVDVAGLKAQIGAFNELAPVKPVSKVADTMDDGTEYQRTAVKSDWIAQLLALDPEAQIWDDMMARHCDAHAGKEMITARSDRLIRIRAKIIEAHPELGQAFKGGWPEVSFFWYCPKTGAPMKARMDYIKMRTIVDLKTFTNKGGKPIRTAINQAIATYKYNIQHLIYVEAANAVKALIREHGAGVIFFGDFVSSNDDAKARIAATDWFLKWATQTEDPGFIFVFLKSDKAPVARGKIMPQGTVFSVTRSRVEEMKRQWVACAQTFGTDVWLDVEPIDEVDDEELPLYTTDIGK